MNGGNITALILPEPFERFRETFLRNIQIRSRTARGEFTAGVAGAQKSQNTIKKSVKKSGDALKAQVAENTETLVRAIWNLRKTLYDNVHSLRFAMETWYDIIQTELYDRDPYSAEREEIEAFAKKMASRTGLPFRVNPRYRVWPVSYAGWNPGPVELEAHMDLFYAELQTRMCAYRDFRDLPQLLAWADRMTDFVLHPWADGCGRMSTATVMWISRALQAPLLPHFGPRDEHYVAMKKLDTHTAYFEKCLLPQ